MEVETSESCTVRGDSRFIKQREKNSVVPYFLYLLKRYNRGAFLFKF